MIVQAHLTFGAGGNAHVYQLEGWSAPEGGFTWAIGTQCSLALPCPAEWGALELELEIDPFIRVPDVPRQRLAVFIGTTLLGTETLDRATTLCLDVPQNTGGEAGTLHLTLKYPDAAIPASLGLSEDARRLALMVRSVRLLETPAAPPFLPRWV